MLKQNAKRMFDSKVFSDSVQHSAVSSEVLGFRRTPECLNRLYVYRTTRPR